MNRNNENKFMISYKLNNDKSVESLNYIIKIDASCVFEDFKKKVDSYLFIERQLPKYTPRYYWITNQGYEIELDYQMDFSILLEEFKDVDIKHIYVSPLKIIPINERPITTNADTVVRAGARAQSVPKLDEQDDVWNFVIHDNVSCDGCGLEPLVGFRYKCYECTNYDLCQSCEAKHKHPEHMMIRIPNNTKVSPFGDIKHRSIIRVKKERKSAENRCSHKSRKETEEEAAADQAAGGARSSSIENRRHGRKHHKRHVRNSFFTGFYEMMQDFAENGANAAFAAANVAINAASGVGDNYAVTAEDAVKTPVTNATAASSSSATNATAAADSSSATNATAAGSSSSATNAQTVDLKPDCSRYTNMEAKQEESIKEQSKTGKKIPPAIVPIPSKGNLTESLINFAKITADLIAYEHAVNGNGAAAAAGKTQSKAAASKEQEKEKHATETENQKLSTSSVAKDQNIKMNDDNIVIDKQPTSTDQMMKPVGDLNGNINEAKKDEELNNSTSKVSIVDGGEKEPPLLLAQAASLLAASVSKSEETNIQSEEKVKNQSVGNTPSLGNSRASSVMDDWQILDGNSSFDNAYPDSPPMLIEDTAAVHIEELSPTSTQQTQTAQEPIVSTSTASTNTDGESPSLGVAPIPTEPIRIPQEEMRAVPVYHIDDRINNSVLAMMSMGFSNEGAWLTQLLENVDGNISSALDLMSTTQRNSA